MPARSQITRDDICMREKRADSRHGEGGTSCTTRAIVTAIRVYQEGNSYALTEEIHYRVLLNSWEGREVGCN